MAEILLAAIDKVNTEVEKVLQAAIPEGTKEFTKGW